MSAGGPLATPVLTGGTGRSGTTVIAKLLDRHPDLSRSLPWEVRFLTDRFGLCDLVEARRRRGPAGLLARAGTGSVRRFEQRLRGRWYRRTAGDGKDRGLFQAMPPEAVDAALDGFAGRLRQDAPAAARRLVHDLLDPAARRRGGSRWIETTPDNALRAHELVRIFPDLRLVHMQRDGRDTAASVASRYWGPDSLEDALVWWERRTLAIHRSVSQVPGHVLTVRLEDLVERDREATLLRLLDFLGLSHAPQVLAWHAESMRPEHAHLQRWRTGLDPARARAVDDLHARAVERLRRQGVDITS